MNYNAKQLLQDILEQIDWVILCTNIVKIEKIEYRHICYMIDLYWHKFGINLRLTNQKVGDFISRCHEIYGE